MNLPTYFTFSQAEILAAINNMASEKNLQRVQCSFILNILIQIRG